ncbi:uncharacterized protein LOC134725230 [Mytilus trossulus]|uniref:uncharacterized protein LOC134725230 n=1 Tax=Mytilus trossulus TaxID=6551 RepID=UPI00300603A0
MSSSTCLVIAKGVYTTEQMAYCRRKLMDFYCNGNIISIIFRLNIKYLQWICNGFQDPQAKPYFRVISQIDNKYAYTTFGNTENTKYAVTTTDVQNEVKGDDLCIRIIVGSAVFFGAIIVFLLLIVYILRRKLKVASYTGLTPRRDQHIYNETTGQSSVTGHYHEIVPLSEMASSRYQPTDQHNIDQRQQVDTSL